MSIIDGDGDGGVCDDGRTVDVVIAGNEDRPLDINEDEGMMLVSRLSKGHQSNVVNGVPDMID